MLSLPDSLSATVDSLRRPAYTGAQRCLPCTLVNLALLAIAVIGLSRRRRPLALALAAIGVGGIWLRGYVVPYTPRFAPRLVASVGPLDGVFHAGDERFPDSPGSLAAASATGDDSDGSDSSDGHSASAESAVTADGATDDAGDVLFTSLLAAGVLAEREDGSLALSEKARDRWRAEMRSLESRSSEVLATEALEVTPTATESRVIDGEHPDETGRWIALGNGTEIATETWLSRPVAIAEVAAVRALEAFELPFEMRLAAARPLRMFLETCPDCGGRVEETTTATCCGGVTNPRQGPQEVLACADCGERLFTFE